MLRVVVIEDSDIVRTHIVNVLRAQADFEVVGEASDGRLGLELCQRLRPDVVTIDMMMPGMNGLQATEHIMAHCPTPILIVSASVNRGEMFKTYDALQAGAVEVMEKPTGNEAPGVWEAKLASTLRLVSRIRVITHPRGRREGLRRPPSPTAGAGGAAERRGEGAAPGRFSLCVVGASTGGPHALAEVFRVLPADFPLPILFVLHIGEPFARSYADWLAQRVRLPVRMVTHGEVLPAPGQGVVLMAPADQHLKVRGGRLWLTDEPERHGCRPAVDVLFESAARELGSRTLAVLLTGMGRDGAAGMLAIRRTGGMTLAQDQSTSVVFGMPKEAIDMGAAVRVLPLPELGPALAELAVAPERP